MREIKFRAWDHVNKELVFADIMEGNVIEEWVAWDLPPDSPVNTGQGFDIMQFAGITDRNGAEIYEGDLIKNNHGRTSEVVWNKFTGSFDSKLVSDDGSAPPYQDKSHGFHNASWRYEVEVIGNIYQNPELNTN